MNLMYELLRTGSLTHSVRAHKQLLAGHYREAVSEYNIAISQDKRNPNAYLGRARAYTQLHDYQSALRDCDEAIAIGGQTATALADRAKVLIATANYDKAISDCDRALKLTPDFSATYQIRATAHIKQSDFRQAVDDLQKFIASKPTANLAEAYGQLGDAFFHQNKNKEAIEAYNAGLALPDVNANLLIGRAQCYAKDKEYEKALADCDKFFSAGQSSVEAYLVSGSCHRQLKQIKQAIADFSHSLNINAHIPRTYVERAECYLVNKQFGDAIADCDEALSLDPSNQKAQDLRKVAYGNVSHMKPIATVDSSELNSTPSGSANALAALGSATTEKGYALLRAGNAEAAIDVLSRVVRAKPNDITARRYLAHAFAENGESQEAVRQFAELEKIPDLNAADQLTYGQALLNSGEKEKGIDVLQTCLEANPAFTGARIALVKAYQKIGFKEKAMQTARDGLGLASTTADRAELEELIRGQ
jgi:tetratricopeptide (TPR) repeat protein